MQPNIIKFSIKLARLLRHLIFYAGISLRQIEKSFKPSDSGQKKSDTKTFVRGQDKIGRNEPCPCGSGKKYKKCHGMITQ